MTKLSTSISQPIKHTELPRIYVIMPTYYRRVQRAELTRIKNTLLNVENLHWLLIEDANQTSDLVASVLNNSGLSYTHMWMQKNDVYRYDDRGISQRNKGLEWVRRNADRSKGGVVYFADDDNTYDIKLFEQVTHDRIIHSWY